MNTDAALHSGNEQIAQADVRERTSHHHLVVSAPGSVGIEARIGAAERSGRGRMCEFSHRDRARIAQAAVRAGREHSVPDHRNWNMTRARLLLAMLVALLALPSTASAALTYGEVPRPTTYTNGTVTFAIAAAPQGTLNAFLRVDGTAAGSASSWPATFTYDTSSLSEGGHTFEIVTEVAEDFWIVDRRWTINVDRTPPSSGPMPVGPLQLSTTASAMRLEWWLAGEMGTIEGTACTTTCRPIDAHDLLRLVLPVGTTTVRAWVRDLAGNSDPSRATVWTITRVDPSPPPGAAPPVAPRAARGPRPADRVRHGLARPALRDRGRHAGGAAHEPRVRERARARRGPDTDRDGPSR